MNTTRSLCFRSKDFTGVCVALICVLWLGVFIVRATDRYVVEAGTIENGKDVPPYNTWTNAATNIQWAVDVAANTETVLVSNGTYNLTNQITFTNGITVRSVNGRDATFINGNYPDYTNRCFYITNSVVIDGFTISNGFAFTNSVGGAYGGGVYVSAAGAYVQNCAITGNKAFALTNNVAAGGGGIYVNGLSYVINCAISYNFADTQISAKTGIDGGGGLYVGGGAIVSNCAIFTNVTWCSTTTNVISTRGGGIKLGSGGSTIANCNIYSNWAQGQGGGVYGYSSGGTIRHCTVNNNYAGSGSGIDLEYGGLIENCLLVSNMKSVALLNYSCIARNCTIVNNPGGGVRSWTSGTRFENLIIYYNGNKDTSGGSMTFSNCCSYTGLNLNDYGTGNITNAPMFVNTNAGNYRLSNNSPCINRGTNQSWMTNAVDLDGRMRIRYGIVDMGAYERIHEATFYRFH